MNIHRGCNKPYNHHGSAIIIFLMQINQTAPDFELPDLSHALHKLSNYRGQVVILNFWSAECPHSVRTDEALIAALSRWGKGVILFSVAANTNESVELLKAVSIERHVSFVLIDHEHKVADLYEAITTPHVFIIDREGILRYRGAVDDVDFKKRLPTRSYLVEAVEALLSDKSVPLMETTAYGCAIVRAI